MAYNLNEYAKVLKAGQEYEKAVLQDLLRQSKILQLIPIKPVQGLKVRGTRWQTLPSTAFRKIGGAYTEGTGVTENTEETLAVLGGDILVDRVFTKVKDTLEDPLVTQTKMKVAALTAKINDAFINGDQAVDPDSFEGLKKRTTNAPSRMTIDLVQTTDSLKVLASTANEHLFLDALHDAMHYVDPGKSGDVCFFMNETTYLGVGKTLRRLNLLDTTKDQYDRTWDTFMGAKLVDIGLQRDQSTEIITNTEEPGDGGADATSIYVARLGTEDGLHMLELQGTSPLPYDPIAMGEGGISSQNVGVARRIDWVVGLRNAGRYAVARIKNFKMAAA